MNEYKYDFNYPEALYKYIPSDRLKFFENFGLRFTQKTSLNDPFEQSSIDRNDFENLSIEEKKAFLANCSNGHVYSESLVEKVLSKKFSSSEKINDGIVSFSETPDNLLMWSLYSSDHRGFCIEFDSSYFMGFVDGIKASPFNLLRVRYRDSRADLQTSGWHNWWNRTNHKTVLTTKSSHWSHELEWRAYADLSNDIFDVLIDDNGVQKIDSSGNKFFIHKVPTKYIRKIIFGASCDIESMIKIKNIISNNPALKHISMKISVVDPIEFKIRLINIKPEDFNNFESNLNAA